MKKVYPVPIWVLFLIVLFSTTAHGQYCTPTGGGSSTTYYINNVTTTGGITNIAYTASSYTAYVNNSATTFSQLPGASVNVSMGISGGSTYYYYCWVDWNNDFTFNTTNEQIWATTTYTSSPYTAGVIAVPPGQAAGSYRVRFATSFIGAVTSCGPSAYGNYVDYTLVVGTLSPCSGVPNAGVATATPSAGSPSSTFNVSATGVTNAGSISYQWQQSANGTTGWSNVASATTVTSAITAPATFGTTTYYRLRTTCAITGDSNFSNVVSFLTSYCTPTGGSSSTSYYINNLTTTGGITNISYTASSYSAFVNNSATSFSQLPGASVNVSMAAAGSTTYYWYCWVDWDNNGIFNTTNEQLWATTTYTASPYTVGVINVPVGQTAGTYRVRFSQSGAGANTACGPAPYGNYVDYSIVVGTLSPCAGMPNAGTASANPSSGSPSSTFNAIATGITNAGGMTYQWQSAPAATGPWTAVAGATLPNSSMTASAVMNNVTYYRLKSTCTNTNDSIFSNAVTFTTSYCVPTAGSSSTSYYLNNITTTGGTSNLAYTASSYTAYVNNSGTTFSQLPGASVNVSMGASVASTYYYRCWVDWNNDGIFNTTNEQIWATTTYTAPPYTNSIPVPAGQTPGTYRVRFAISFSGAIVSCGPAPYGNYVDFSLIVGVLSPCTGMPNAGTAAASPTSGSPSSTFNVSATGITNAGGMAYQWQQSASATGPWSNVSGATLPTASITATATFGVTTYYRMKSTCTNTNDSIFSNVVSFTTSYCTPTAGTSSTSYYINNITTTGGTTNIAYTASSYSAYVNNSATTFSRLPGGNINVSIGLSVSSTYYYYCWVDWDNNGIFNTTNEQIWATTSYTAPPYAGVIAIPSTQTPGSYRVRFATSFSGAIVACGPAPYGNYVDYTLIVISPCNPPTNLAVSNLTDVSATLGWTPVSGSTGYEYVVDQVSTNPTAGTAITAATFSTSGLTPNTTYYLHVRNNCGTSGYSAWATLSFKTCAASVITPLSTTTFCTGANVVLTAPAPPAGSTYTYQWAQNGTNVGTASSYTASASGNYTLVLTNVTGNCVATISPATQVTVGAPPSSAITPANTAGLCPGGSVALTTNTAPGLVLTWYLNGVVIPGASSATYNATVVGNYTANVSSGPGCNSTTATPTVVSLLTPPAAAITPLAHPVICQSGTTTLTATAGTNFSYQWYFNGAPVGTNSITYAAANAGAYTVKVTNNTISCGATSTATNLTLVPLPPSLVSPSTASSGCDSLLLMANSGPGYTYKWKLNNNVILNASAQTYAAIVSGSYAALVTDTNGCVGTSANVAVTINPSPSAVITYSSPIAFCQGGAVALNSYVSNGLTYQWLANGTNIAGDTNSTFIAYQPGSYSLKVKNIYGCTKVSDPLLVQVYPLPTPTITRDVDNKLSTGSYISYQWYRDNQPIPGAVAQTYQTVQNGGYAVDVKDANGCQSKSPVQFINNTGISTVTKAGIRIYPNPTHDVIYIDAPMAVNITVRDMQGRNIIVAPDAKKIDLSAIADGVYMLVVSDSQDELIGTERLIKKQ